MPTQHPFLSNFLAAFRAHPQPLSKATPSLSSTAAVASPATIWTSATQQSPRTASPGSEPMTSSPKPINAKTNPYHTQPLQHHVSPQTHMPKASPGIPIYGPPNKPQPSYPSVQDVRRSRRGSDSSSEGFRETRGGGEKWFIGGLTATGEEKYYKLSMVKRDKSLDRISTDQMSL